MRRWRIGWVWLCAAVFGAGAAQACMLCSSDLACAWSPSGARWCIGGQATCILGGLCSGRAGQDERQGVLDGIDVTLLEAVPTAAVAPARVERAAGPLATGRQAQRIARGGGAVVFSGSGYAGGGTAVFRAPAGDGFTLTREADGRGAHLRVCALAGGESGRVLADERVGEGDALVVRVPFDGRTRVLVVQAPTLPRAEAERHHRDAVRAIHEAGMAPGDSSRPPFELSVLDR